MGRVTQVEIVRPIESFNQQRTIMENRNLGVHITDVDAMIGQPGLFFGLIEHKKSAWSTLTDSRQMKVQSDCLRYMKDIPSFWVACVGGIVGTLDGEPVCDMSKMIVARSLFSQDTVPVPFRERHTFGDWFTEFLSLNGIEYDRPDGYLLESRMGDLD